MLPRYIPGLQHLVNAGFGISYHSVFMVFGMLSTVLILNVSC